MIGSLAAARALTPPLGVLGVLVGTLGVLWSIDLLLTSGRRLAAARESLAGGAAAAAAPGAPITRAAGVVLIIGVASLVAVFLMAAQRP